MDVKSATLGKESIQVFESKLLRETFEPQQNEVSNDSIT
jgi:hypothetical protein